MEGSRPCLATALAILIGASPAGIGGREVGSCLRSVSPSTPCTRSAPKVEEPLIGLVAEPVRGRPIIVDGPGV